MAEGKQAKVEAITLKVVAQDGTEVSFKVKPKTKFSKSSICSHQASPASSSSQVSIALRSFPPLPSSSLLVSFIPVPYVPAAPSTPVPTLPSLPLLLHMPTPSSLPTHIALHRAVVESWETTRLLSWA
ncbi:unnamed protein product [Closterium sp. Yama58-4]|nr:unnamed protein product [Closterium sp. Yama58-4]